MTIITAEKITPQTFGKVVVLMGGTSSEREISLLSGKNVLEALLACGIDAYPLDVGPDVIEQLLNVCPDRAFIALHGVGGEDGIIQGVLETLHIPYTGSGVLASALAMDKHRSKIIFDRIGLPVLPSISLIIGDAVLDALEELEFPLCVKPSLGGSTIGISKVQHEDQLQEACDLAFQHSDEILLEPWIAGREFTVSILGEEALPPIEIVPAEPFYDYKAKYFTDQTQYFCPCDLTEEQQLGIQDITLEAFEALGCRHFGRADFIMDVDGDFWLLEMNTIPGMTSHSLVPMAAKAIGIDFNSLVCKILEFTL